MTLRSYARKMCESEYVAYRTYMYVSKYVVSGKLKLTLEKALSDEFRHYRFWSELCGDCGGITSSIKVLALFLFSILFGVTILIKVLERAEGDTSKLYERLSKENPEFSDVLKAMAEDEDRHESEFASNIDEARIKYLSSITLGVSDAIIELTGVYTGALGMLESTKTAGTIGLLAGISASASMAAASYAQAKHEVWKKPYLAAIYTGTSYLAVVSLLALPYFLTESLLTAFALMVAIANIVIAYISVYGAVILSKSFLREFFSNVALLLGISTALYALGRALGTAILGP
ncbi:MAG: ferritin family protein [Sulfolobales archaeon]